MMKILFRSFLGLVLLFIVPVPNGFGESSKTNSPTELQAEIETLKEGQKHIRQELKEIKALIQGLRPTAPTMPKNLVLSIKDDPFKGSPSAPVTLIEFSDYQCPYCARHVRQTLPKIEQNYIATGKVKYVFRDFPLTSIHKQAFKAAEAANCAGDQGKYWEMHDLLFKNQKALGLKDLIAHAETIGLEKVSFLQCLSSGTQTKEIQEDLAEGQKASVRGTPTFYLGRTDSESQTVKVLNMLRGAQAYPKFQQAIDSILKK